MKQRVLEKVLFLAEKLLTHLCLARENTGQDLPPLQLLIGSQALQHNKCNKNERENITGQSEGRTPLREVERSSDSFKSHFFEGFVCSGSLSSSYLCIQGPIFKFLSIPGHHFFISTIWGQKIVAACPL